MSELNVPKIQQDIVVAQTWLQKHERLLIVCMVILASYFVLDKSLGIVSNYEGHKAQQAASVTAAQAAKNQEALTQAQQLLQSYQQQLTASIAANQQLTVAITKRDSQLSVQQKTDATLAPPDLANRWASLVKDTGIVPATGGYAVTESAAVSTVLQLEAVPVLTQDLNDEKVKEANLQTDVTNANALIDKGKTVVGGLQLQLTDQSKQCTIDLNAEKAKAREGKTRAFGIGYVAGLVSGFVLHFF